MGRLFLAEKTLSPPSIGFGVTGKVSGDGELRRGSRITILFAEPSKSSAFAVLLCS